MSGEPSVDHASGWWDRRYLDARAAWSFTAVMGLMSASSATITLTQLATGFRARRFCMNVIAARYARLILRLHQVHVRGHGLGRWPEGQCVFVGNHTSTLDFFVVTALALPNARAFLSKKLRIFLPIGVMGHAMGSFFTPPQSEPDARVDCFKHAAEELKKSGDSVFLTPEGTRWTDGRNVGPFNKGSFHLAIDLKAPIVPIFISIPARINPGKGLRSRPGTLDVYVHPPIPTDDWTLETLEAHKNFVRERYLNFPEGWHQTPVTLDGVKTP